MTMAVEHEARMTNHRTTTEKEVKDYDFTTCMHNSVIFSHKISNK
jgi:hypothetical protein